MWFRFSLCLICMWGALPGFAERVSVVGEPGAWRLMVEGEPFYVQGVTWQGGEDGKHRWRTDFETLNRLNVNAIRIWGVGPEAEQLLDMAHEYGIKVMVGLWLRHGQAGAEDDDEFDWINDAEGRDAQWDDTVRDVRRLKHHPALLCWGLGNEVILNIGTEEEKEAYAIFLGKLAAEIKRLDPDHPIASVSAWSLAWPYWKKYAPAIDIYGINVYGYGAEAIPGELERLGINRPYLICEFGATGEWETPPDHNGVKLDPGEDHKRSIIADGWGDMVSANAGVNLGGFVFHLGSALDHTGLWLSLRADGMWRPAYHGTMKAFTGEFPVNRMPIIERFEVETLDAGQWAAVSLAASDPEGAALNVRFMFNERRGPREYRGGVHFLDARQNKSGKWEIRLPKVVEPGGIKLYAAVDDGVNLSIAQYSVLVD